MILRVLPIELDGFSIGLEFPGEGMDRPFDFQFVVDETEGLAAPEKGNVGVVESRFFGYLPFGGGFG
jgi:hypothetical protein